MICFAPWLVPIHPCCYCKGHRVTAIEKSKLIFTTKLGKKNNAFFHLPFECKRQRSPLCHNCLKLESKGSGLLMLVWAFHQGGWSQKIRPSGGSDSVFYLCNKGIIKEMNMIITYLVLHRSFPD